jgi:hypothetical protein
MDKSSSIPSSSVENHECLKDYVNDGCYLNECIRSDDINNRDATTCAKIDACFKDFTAEKELILYRGVESKEQLITNIGYTSTSLSFAIARDFTKTPGIVAHITIPQGTKLKAIRITSCGEFSNEDEVLFPCNTSFKIINTPIEIPSCYKRANNGKVVWEKNENIQIVFATLDKSPSIVGGKNLKNKLRLCSTNKVYTIYGVSQDRYIRVKSQRVYLKSIQRQYRFI